MARDTQCHRRAFGGKHARERVKRPRPLYQGRILKAEALLTWDELVVHGNVVAAGAAQPGRIPGVKNFALLEPYQALPRFGNAGRVHPRHAVLDDVAAEPQPFTVVAPAD